MASVYERKEVVFNSMIWKRLAYNSKPTILTAAQLAQLEEHQSAEPEVMSSNPGQTFNQGL